MIFRIWRYAFEGFSRPSNWSQGSRSHARPFDRAAIRPLRREL